MEPAKSIFLLFVIPIVLTVLGNYIYDILKKHDEIVWNKKSVFHVVAAFFCSLLFVVIVNSAVIILPGLSGKYLEEGTIMAAMITSIALPIVGITGALLTKPEGLVKSIQVTTISSIAFLGYAWLMLALWRIVYGSLAT